MTPVQRIRWVRQVALSLRIRDGFKTDAYVAFAGVTYIDPLARELAYDGIRIEQPLRGKQVGQRLHWLKEHT